MDPNDIQPKDVYDLGLWMVKVLYSTLLMGAIVLALTVWNVAVTWRSSQDKRRLTKKVEALLVAMQAENRMKESQESRTKSNLEKTERVLEKVVAAATPPQPTPSEGTIKVVVVNPPDHPVPVAHPDSIPEGVAAPDGGVRVGIPPTPQRGWKPGKVPPSDQG